MITDTTIEQKIFNMALAGNKPEIRRLLSYLSEKELTNLSNVITMLLDEIDLWEHKM